MKSPENKENRLSNLLPQLFGISAASIGFVALLGWIFGFPFLTSFSANLIPMAPSTALLFMLFGIVFFLRNLFPKSRGVYIAGITVGSVGAIMALLLFYFSSAGIYSHIELFEISIEGTVGGVPIGHMSPLTAACFIVAAFSFLATLGFPTGRPGRAKAALVSACVVVLTSVVLMLAYFLGKPLLYGGEFIPPALSTSLAFLFLSLGLIVTAGLQVWPLHRVKESATSRVSYILALVFILLTSGIVGIGYFYYSHYERQYRMEIERQLSAIGELKTDELARWRKERLGDAAAIYKNVSFSELVRQYLERPNNSDVQKRLRTWMGGIREADQYDRICLHDTELVERLSDPEEIVPTDSIFLGCASEVLRTRQITFQDFYRDKQNGRIYLNMLVPILDYHHARRVIGILAMQIDPEQYLYPLINRWPIPTRSAETLIIRREENDALFLNELRFQKNTALTLRIPLNQRDVAAVRAARGEEGIIEGIDYRGVHVIAYVRPIPNSPWFLVAREDFSDIFSPLQERLWMLVIFICALIIGAGASVGLVWRHQRAGFYREKYEAAEALGQSQDRYRSLFENMIEGYAYCKMLFNSGKPEDFIYIDVNHEFESITGLKNVTGKKVSEVIPGIQESNPELFEIYGRVALTGNPERFETYVASLGIWFSIAAYSPAKEDFVAVFNNITERKRAEEEIQKLYAELETRVVERTSQLEAANKELEAFSYSVSHDLRAPLRAIDGFSRIVVDEYANKLDAEGNRLLNIVRANTQKMDELITDLLALSRFGRSEMQFSRVDMSLLADSIYCEIASPEVQEKFSFLVEPLPDAHCDSALMRHVWTNLLSNAIKFTTPKADRKIEVNGRCEDGMNIYSVKDSGVGFDSNYGHKLFGVFQRLHTAEEFEGTGVGLAIVQRIIHRHGGRVWAEGTVGKGATFFFSIPVGR